MLLISYVFLEKIALSGRGLGLKVNYILIGEEKKKKGRGGLIK